MKNSQLAQPEEPANKKRKTEQKGEDNNDDHVEITAEALARLKGAEDQQVEEFWLKCSTRQQQVLWKKFQSMRKSEGTEIAYQDATKGVGRNGKTKILMKTWLKRGSSKHPVMIQHMTELRTTDTFRSKEKWLPLESIKQKYGAAELKARVRGGSILVRKSVGLNPSRVFLIGPTAMTSCIAVILALVVQQLPMFSMTFFTRSFMGRRVRRCQSFCN